LFENAVDKHFDKFEVFVLKNIFKIPQSKHLKLPHFPTEAGDWNELKQVECALEQVKKEIVAVIFVNSSIRNVFINKKC
jgi:hypothetical protein